MCLYVLVVVYVASDFIVISLTGSMFMSLVHGTLLVLVLLLLGPLAKSSSEMRAGWGAGNSMNINTCASSSLYLEIPT